jgi:hypothetical protein
VGVWGWFTTGARGFILWVRIIGGCPSTTAPSGPPARARPASRAQQAGSARPGRGVGDGLSYPGAHVETQINMFLRHPSVS